MIPNPHHSIFKAVFRQPEHARGVLRAILSAPRQTSSRSPVPTMVAPALSRGRDDR
jgi:hypothetical protein